MKKMLLCAAIVICIVGTAAAQYDASGYLLNYYSNHTDAIGIDQFTRIVNPGGNGTPLTGMHAAAPTNTQIEGTVCANIYVFDATQEMDACCSCPITANGLLVLSLNTNLLVNPLKGSPGPADGVIKVVGTELGTGSSYPGPLVCGEETALPNTDDGRFGLLGWQTHVQVFTPAGGMPTAVVTEDRFQSANLTHVGDSDRSERAFLSQACSFVQYLGSGTGLCTCPVVGP